MIASYPDRRFQLWEYRVSHGSLLIRSPKGPNVDRNVDLVFVGVDYVAAPRFLHGVEVIRGAEGDQAAASAAIDSVDPERVFVLLSGGRRYLVVAVSVRIGENDDEIFDSPFAT